MSILEIISPFDSASKIYRILLCVKLARNATRDRDRVGATNAAPFIWRNIVSGWSDSIISPSYRAYPGRAMQLPYISLQTLANRLHEKQLSWPAFFDDRITFLAQLIFLHIKTGSPKRGSTRSRRGNQSMR